MKKLQSVVLVISMLMVFLIAPIQGAAQTADTPPTPTVSIPDQAETVELDGQAFTVVRTADQFLKMAPTGNYARFILANDIDFTGVELKTQMGNSNKNSVVNAGNKMHHFTLEGNGYTLKNMILNFDQQDSGLFASATYRSNLIRNLTVEATCSFTAADCGIFFGKTADNSTSIAFENVTVKANVTGTLNRTSGFIGDNRATNGVSFKNCSFIGSLKSAQIQSACFIGMQSAASAVTFENCSYDASIEAGNNRIGGFIGQVNADAQISFVDCTAEGTLTEPGAKWLSGYIGANYKPGAVISFERCVNRANITGNNMNAGFIGQTKGTNTFVDCVNAGTVHSNGSAAGFVANRVDGTVSVSFTRCLNVGKPEGSAAYAFSNAATSFADCYFTDGTLPEAATGAASAAPEQIASGELAFRLAAAQKAAGVAPENLFGQTIGTDLCPVIGGKTVYEESTKTGTKFYTNSILTLNTKTDGTPDVFYQLRAAGTDKQDARIILCIKSDYIAEIQDASIRLSFGLTNGAGQKTLTLGKKDIILYQSVMAGGEVCSAAEGCVLMAVTVRNIVNTEWNGEMRVTLSAQGSANVDRYYQLDFNGLEK